MLSTRSHSASAANGMRSPEKPGSMPLVNSVVPPAVQAASSRLVSFGVGARRMDEVHHRRGDDVLAGTQQRGDLGDGGARPRLTHSGVDDTVGLHGEQPRGVVGRNDAGARVSTRQLAGVAADLRWVVHVEADEVEVGILDERTQRVHADRAGRPLDHSVRRAPHSHRSIEKRTTDGTDGTDRRFSDPCHPCHPWLAYHSGNPTARSEAMSAASCSVSLRIWVRIQALTVKPGRSAMSCRAAARASSRRPACSCSITMSTSPKPGLRAW